MTETPRDPRIPPLMSVPEVADALGISRQAVRKAAARGQILGAKVGEVWVFRPAVVERVKQRRAPSSTE